MKSSINDPCQRRGRVWAALSILCLAIFVMPIAKASSTELDEAAIASQDLSNVLQLHMNEGTGTVAYDSSLYQNDGALKAHHGTRCGASWVYGKYGKALSFDGFDDYVEVPDDPTLRVGTNDWSVECWFKTSADMTGDNHRLVTKGDMMLAPSKDGYALVFWGVGGAYTNNHVVAIFSIENGPEYIIQTNNALNDGNWHHVAAIIDRDGLLKMYVDGVPQADTEDISAYAGHSLAPTTPLGIGRGFHPTLGTWREPFQGTIDEARIYNRVLSPDEVMDRFKGVDIRGDLAVEWRFDEGRGEKASDTHMWASGKYCEALQFDGMDDRVDVDDSASLNPTGGITVAAWVKVDGATGDHQVIVSKWAGYPSGCQYVLELQPNGVTPQFPLWFAGDGSATVVVSSQNIVFGFWYHIAGTWDGSVMKIYVNGVERGILSKSGTLQVNTRKLCVGAHYIPGDYNWLKGKIDEAHIYNRALVQEEITQLMNPPAAELKTWYHIGTTYYKDGWVDLDGGDRVAQGFTAPRTWSVDTISLYAAEGSGYYSKTKNDTEIMVVSVQVELRSGWPDGPVLASGNLYLTYPQWCDVILSNVITLNAGSVYYIVAYSNLWPWHIYYHNDGSPDNDGAALVKRYYYWWWEQMAVDFMVRYRAEYTIDAERAEHLNSLARDREPLLKYYWDEPYFPCDFYFDKEMDIRNNDVNYDNRGNNLQYDDNYRVFIHVEEWTFHDAQPLSETPMIAIEYWYYYANDFGIGGHMHDFEMHCVVFLDQSTEQVLLVGMAHHLWVDYYDPLTQIDWWTDSNGKAHPICYLEYGKHAAWPDSSGQTLELKPNEVLDIYVFDTVPYTTTWPHEWGTFCDITNWWGTHVRWNYNEGGWADPDHGPANWWPWEFGAGVGPAPWRRYCWDEPTSGSPN